MIGNGIVVIERLQSAQRSLQRSVEAIERELEHREEREEYRDVYLNDLSNLVSKSAALEDEIRKKLSFA